MQLKASKDTSIFCMQMCKTNRRERFVCSTVPLATMFFDIFNMTRSWRNPLCLHIRKKINQTQSKLYNEMAQNTAICFQTCKSNNTLNNTCVYNNYNIHFLQTLVWPNTISRSQVFSFLSICNEATCHHDTLPAPCIRSQMNLYLRKPAKSIGVQVCILHDHSSSSAFKTKTKWKAEMRIHETHM